MAERRKRGRGKRKGKEERERGNKSKFKSLKGPTEYATEGSAGASEAPKIEVKVRASGNISRFAFASCQGVFVWMQFVLLPE